MRSILHAGTDDSPQQEILQSKWLSYLWQNGRNRLPRFAAGCWEGSLVWWPVSCALSDICRSMFFFGSLVATKNDRCFLLDLQFPKTRPDGAFIKVMRCYASAFVAFDSACRLWNAGGPWAVGEWWCSAWTWALLVSMASRWRTASTSPASGRALWPPGRGPWPSETGSSRYCAPFVLPRCTICERRLEAVCFCQLVYLFKG